MRCASPSCRAPEDWRGAEHEPTGHAEVPGVGPMHFACWHRWLRESGAFKAAATRASVAALDRTSQGNGTR